MMRCLITVFLLVSGASSAVALAQVSASVRGQGEGLFAYRFERGALRYADVVTLRNGRKHLGKAMEWADQVLLFDAAGRPVVFGAGDVEECEFQRYERHTARPDLPDLTVAFVERLPRDLGWHWRVDDPDGAGGLKVDADPASWHPAAGSQVTFRIHVLNAGGVASTDVPCRVLVDGKAISSARIPALEAGKEHVLDVPWRWEDGRHALRVELDPGGEAQEIVRWNNMHSESTDALALTVVVAADRYASFRDVPNIVDSFCFEDWLQYQVRVLHALFASSVYPSSPEGIVERIRCDRILVVPNPMDPQQRSGWADGLRRNGDPTGPTEYGALWVLGPLEDDAAPKYDALKVDWPGLRQLGLSLGLVDLTSTDTTIDQCLAVDRHGRYAQRRHLFPWPQTMMYRAGALLFDERSVAFLNHARGRPRGLQGDFLYQLPGKITIEARSNVGTPLADVQVDVYQLMSEGEFAGAIAGFGRGDPLVSGHTGLDGRLTLPDRDAPSRQTPGGYELRANPFGKIATDGSNGLLLLRLECRGNEEFRFLRLFDCNLAALGDPTREYVHALRTRFGEADAPPPPAFAAVRMPDRSVSKPPMHVKWPVPPVEDRDTIDAFRVYRRTSFAGESAKPWTLMSTVRMQDGRWKLQADGTYFEEFQYDGPYSLDTYYAVSVVDRQGRESSLSSTGYLAYDKESVKLAMDAESATITLKGDGPCRMIRWDGESGMQSFGIRTRRFKDYVPSCSGVAFASDGRLVVTDPVNHVLALYDRGDLVELLPNRKWWPGFASDEPGEFYAPADVAVDDAGNMYVADRNNHRVQVLDPRGRFKAMLDADFRFVGPHAVGYANGHVCVTDKAGTRCRVYAVESEAWRFVRELPPLLGADRGLVAQSGNVYVSGRDGKGGSTGILVYTPKGDSAVLDHVETEGKMGKFHHARGLWLYRGGAGDYVYLVNEFPFDVRRTKLK